MKRMRWTSFTVFTVLILLALAACTPGSGTSLPAATALQSPPAGLPTPSSRPTPVADRYLSEKDAGTTVQLKVGNTLVVSLDGNPTTGFTWELAPGENPVLNQLDSSSFEADSSLLGASGKITLLFKAASPGQQMLNLVYHRPFEKNTPPEKTFTVTVIVAGEGTGLPQSTPLAHPTPSMVVYPSGGAKGWLTYTDPTYGFSFQYPPEWKLEPGRGTMAGHAVWLTPNITSLARLQIAYKRADDSAQIGRTGLGSGDLVQLGQVLFLGKEINREVLVFAGKHMTVRYTCSGGCMQRGDLVFGFDLDYLGNWNDPSALPEDVQADADLIVASIQLTGTYP